MWQLSELAHEYTAMGVLDPIQLIGRRRDEYPIVQDTVTDLGLIERSAHRTKLMPPGVMGHLPGNSCTLRTRPVSRPSYLPRKAGAYQSNPARAAPSLTSIKLRLMHTTQNAHTMPT